MVKTLALIAALLLPGIAMANDSTRPLRTKCHADKDCAAPQRCMKANDEAARCEVPCADNIRCPADQRCVKDRGQRVCRPIADGLDL